MVCKTANWARLRYLYSGREEVPLHDDKQLERQRKIFPSDYSCSRVGDNYPTSAARHNPPEDLFDLSKRC